MYSDINCSQASRRYPWRVHSKNQDKPAGSCATVRMPCSVLQINIEDVWMSEQHCPDTRSISIQQEVVFQKSTLFEKSLQAVRTTRQHVRTISSNSEYSRVPFERGKDFSKDRSDTRSSRPDANLIKIELRCFWKDIAENRLDVANFRPDAH
jgi:hypothetical protein